MNVTLKRNIHKLMFPINSEQIANKEYILCVYVLYCLIHNELASWRGHAMGTLSI